MINPSEQAALPPFDPEHPTCPLEIAWAWLTYYKKCHHTIVSPKPAKNQRYRVSAYLDRAGRCPECDAAHKAAKAVRKAAK